MQRGNPPDIQLEPADVVVQIDGEWIWRGRRRCVRSRRRPRVNFNQDFFHREVHHRERVVVTATRNPMNLDRPPAVGEDVFVGECFERGGLVRFRQGIRIDRPRRRPRLLVVRPVHLVRHHRGSLGHVGSQPAGMIEVRVRVHHVTDWLVGNRLFDFRDHGQRARLVLRPFDYHDVIELSDGNAVMASAFQEIDAVGKLFHGNRHRRTREAAYLSRHVDRDRPIRRHRRYGDVEHRMTALSSDDAAGESHAAEVTVVGIGDFDRRVAEHRIVDPRSNALDLVLGVDLPDVSVFPIQGERDLGAAGRRLRGRVVGNSRLDEPVRRRPDLHRPLLDSRRLRLWRRWRAGCRAGRSGHVPGVRAADDLNRTLLNRSRSSPIRFDDLDAFHLYPRGRILIVDGSRETADIERRPRQRGVRSLAELEPFSASRILDRFQIAGAKCSGGGLQRARFRTGTGRKRQGRRKAERENFAHNAPPLLIAAAARRRRD